MSLSESISDSVTVVGIELSQTLVWTAKKQNKDVWGRSVIIIVVLDCPQLVMLFRLEALLF